MSTKGFSNYLRCRWYQVTVPKYNSIRYDIITDASIKRHNATATLRGYTSAMCANSSDI